MLNRDFLNAALMTTTFECGAEELVENSLSGLVVNETARKNQNIGIIMLTNKMSNLLAPCQTGTHTLMLVQCHGNTFTTATNTNTRINLTALNAFSKSVTKVWIVYTSIAISTVILYRITLLFQIFQNELLQWKT